MPSTFYEIQTDPDLIGNTGGQHCIGRTADGILWCVARVNGTTPDTRLFKSADNGQTWTVDGELDSIFGGGDRQLFIDPGGRISIGNWTKNGGNGAHYVHRTGAGSFSSRFVATTTATQLEDAWFARDSDGKGHVVVKPLSAAEIRYSKQANGSEDGGSAWSGITDELVTNVGVDSSSKPVLLIDMNDVPHVIYRDGVAGRYMYTNRSGGSWAVPTEIMASPAVHIGDYTCPCLSVNRLDIHFIFYAGAVGTSVTPYYARRDSVTGIWSTEQVDATFISSSGHISPAIATCQDLQGRIYGYALRDQDTAYFARVSAGNWSKEVFDFGGSNSTGNFSGACQHYPLVNGFPNYPSIAGHFAGRFNNGAAQASRFAYLAGNGITWTSGEDYPRCDPEPVRASLVFAGEGASEATLTIAPDFVFSGEERFVTNRLPTERGYVVTHAKFPTSRRVFSCRFVNRSKADRDALAAFIEARGSGRGAFTLVLPDGSGSVKVAMVEGSLQFPKQNPGVYGEVTFQAQELLN